MEYHFLKDLLIVFALSGLVVYAVRRIRLPAIAGLLITGAVIGPHGLSLVEDVHDLTENVELPLTVRRVSNTDRPRVAVAGQPRHLPLGQPRPPVLERDDALSG